MARERFKEGVAYFDQKQYEKARAAFLQAYALRKHPAVLLNLAQSELRSGHEVDAARHFALFLQDGAELTPTERQSAEVGFAQARNAVVEVTISSDVDGADITVDGTSEGRTPLSSPLFLLPGSHRIELSRDGKVKSTPLTARAGQSLTQRFEFKPKTSSPSVTAKPNDTQTATMPPLIATPVPISDSYPDTSAPRERKPFFVWAAENPAAWVGGALTLLGASSGIGFAVGARGKYDDANHIAAEIENQSARDSAFQAPATGLCNDPFSWLKRVNFQGDIARRTDDYTRACQEYLNNVDAADTFKTLAIASWVVAGAAASATVIYYFVDPSARAPAIGGQRTAGLRLRLTPVIGPFERGIAVSGHF